MISSKEVMERAGISRATLNNYIGLGILKRPNVLSAVEGEPGVPRLGFFPESALTTIEKVKQLKSEGNSMSEIADMLSRVEDSEPADLLNTGSTEAKATPKSAERRGFETESPTSLSVALSVDNIPGPAFMLNNNFELTWWNEYAEDTFFELDRIIDRDIAARNVFHLLLNREQAHKLVNFPQILEVTMRAAKKRMDQKALAKAYPLLEAEDVQLLSGLYEQVEAMGDEDIIHHTFEINDDEGNEQAYTLYICFFREGVFFSFLPADEDSAALVQMLSQRSQVMQDIMKKRRPFLTNLVTMVADLQSSMSICSELPAEEYFELINDIWQGAEPIFRRYKATHGKHVGDGMVYYFLPQPNSDYITNALFCAHELKELMIKMTKEWKARKNWGHDLKLNIGLNEGQEWFGTYHAGTHIEFTVLGDTINHASRLSDFAREGGIWATKGMLSKIKREMRDSVRYGIQRKNAEGLYILSKDLFAQVANLIDLDEGKHYKFKDIAALPVAEVVDVIIPEN
jgi:adenylate cyclase